MFAKGVPARHFKAYESATQISDQITATAMYGE
jgi:hypothetical protein